MQDLIGPDPILPGQSPDFFLVFSHESGRKDGRRPIKDFFFFLSGQGQLPADPVNPLRGKVQNGQRARLARHEVPENLQGSLCFPGVDFPGEKGFTVQIFVAAQGFLSFSSLSAGNSR